MKIEIKNRWDGSVIFSIEAKSLKIALLKIVVKKKIHLRSADLRSADLSSADLRSADLRYANLRSADLSSADLRSADLRYADLSYADLRSADLSYANLRSANLCYAKGINKYRCTPLEILKEQTGNIRAYKLVDKNSEGIFRGGIKYEIDKTAKVDDIDEDKSKQCAAGINLATLDWCMREWREGFRIMIVEFPRWIEQDGEKIDNLVIPIATDGKFRVRECTIVKEKDLVEIGLVKSEKSLKS